jgi:hypothetical protein
VLPADVTAKGGLDLIFEVAADGGAGFPGGAAFNIAGTGIGFSNEAGTVAAEGVDVTAGLSLQPLADGVAFKADLESASGEALLGSAYLRFATYPTRLSSSGTLRDDRLELTSFEVTQQNLLQASGKLRLRSRQRRRRRRQLRRRRRRRQRRRRRATCGSKPRRSNCANCWCPRPTRPTCRRRSPGRRSTRWRRRGGSQAVWRYADSAAVAGTLRLDAITLRDARGIFFIHGLRGGLNWAAEGAGDRGAVLARLGFGRDLRPQRRCRCHAPAAARPRGHAARTRRDCRCSTVPSTCANCRSAISACPRCSSASRAASSRSACANSAGLSAGPSSPAWSRAAYPEWSTTDGTLRVDGDLQAEIFDGWIRGSNIRLGDPFGRWPRLTADLALENLDLEAITSAFEFGTITGRIEGRVDRLELFDWKPVTFDAWLRTPAGDHSRKHISVDAINSIANIGGTAGTGVATALRGGALRFFSRYHYRQLAIRCILDDDICQLSGAPLTGDRYYLLEGAGIPRVDIIGNTGRVQWSEAGRANRLADPHRRYVPHRITRIPRQSHSNTAREPDGRALYTACRSRPQGVPR